MDFIDMVAVILLFANEYSISLCFEDLKNRADTELMECHCFIFCRPKAHIKRPAATIGDWRIVYHLSIIYWVGGVRNPNVFFCFETHRKSETTNIEDFQNYTNVYDWQVISTD